MFNIQIRVFDYSLEHVQSSVPHILDYYRNEFLEMAFKYRQEVSKVGL